MDDGNRLCSRGNIVVSIPPERVTATEFIFQFILDYLSIAIGFQSLPWKKLYSLLAYSLQNILSTGVTIHRITSFYDS